MMSTRTPIRQLQEATGRCEEKILENLANISDDVEKERPINWSIVEKLIAVTQSSAIAQLARYACRGHYRREQVRRRNRRTRRHVPGYRAI